MNSALVDLDDSLFGDNVNAGELLEESSDNAGDGGANSTQLAAGAVSRGAQGEEDDAEMLERLNRLAKEGAAKRKPKLAAMRFDANRLLGEKGLPALIADMQRAPLSGREGRELDDLNAILRAYEQWLHRLHPKLAFDDALDRVERLSRQMTVRNGLRRMRAGLAPIGQTGECGGEGESEADNQKENREPRDSDSDSGRGGGGGGNDDDSGEDDAMETPAVAAAGADSDSGESFALPDTSAATRRRQQNQSGDQQRETEKEEEEEKGEEKEESPDVQKPRRLANANRRRPSRLPSESEGESEEPKRRWLVSDEDTGLGQRLQIVVANSHAESEGERSGDVEANSSGRRRRPVVIDSSDEG